MGNAQRWDQRHEAELRCRLGVKAQRWQMRRRWVSRATWVAFVLVAMVMASAALRYEEQLQQREHQQQQQQHGVAAEAAR